MKKRERVLQVCEKENLLRGLVAPEVYQLVTSEGVSSKIDFTKALRKQEDVGEIHGGVCND